MSTEDNPTKPVIFLAFANDRIDPDRHLPNLVPEAKGIRQALKTTRLEGLCEVVERANAGIDDIFEVFREHQDQIAIFHYGGHADSYRLLLEDPGGGQVVAHREGLASFLGRQQGLQLVFINGCWSGEHARELTRAGVPAVIGTTGSIEDDVAAELAICFYSGLAEGRGRTLERAWGEARDQLLTRQGGGRTRDAAFSSAERFSWDIYYRKGAEAVKDWSLPAAAGNPLYGLPALPESYFTNLPADPFIGLNYFTQREAGIFFGRGKDIRELYNRVTGVHPLILFYGQSGVGKSSLLDAGLAPRIEANMAVCYARRDPALGLSGTLCRALGVEVTADENPDLLSAWQAREAQEGKPLLVILDQAEEAYTRPLPRKSAEKDEWEIFLNDLISIFFNPPRPPQGKLILSYRKEYHPEIRKAFRERRLPYTGLFLEQLDRDGIVEAVEGITRETKLRQRYGLAIESGKAGNLPDIIADDLLEDRDSPVAPMLQILLTNLWQAALEEDSHHPRLRIARYYEIRKRGLAMKDFLNQQLKKLHAWRPEVVDSGLALDLLYAHTTEMGTAGSCTREAIETNFGDREEQIAALIRQCRNLYLLTGRYPDTSTRLSHDTLAPEVRRRYEASERPGQRAARLLEGKMRDLRAEGRGVYLNGRELRTVARGKEGMRHFNEDETRLVQASGRRQWRLWLSAVGMTALLLLGLWRAYDQNQQKDDEIFYKTVLPAFIDSLRNERYYESEKNANGNFRSWFLTSSDSFALISTAYRNILPQDSQHVVDLTGGVYWQRSGSPDKMNYTAAQNYVAGLNQRKHGTYSDWRLPTWEEAMRLLQKDTTANGLHQNRLFDSTREQMWTSDSATAYRAWRIDFRRGRIDGVPFDSAYPVRAVRTVESAKAYVSGMDSLVTTMIRKKGYFDSRRNPDSEGINRNDYPYEPQAEGLVIYDPKTNLSWQRSGSRKYMTFLSARAYIESLNDSSFAGYDDWRLPTLEEAMSLMEPEEKNGDLYIAPYFDATQRWILTSSQWRASAAWYVHFNLGTCDNPDVGYSVVRAVRFGQSSR